MTFRNLRGGIVPRQFARNYFALLHESVVRPSVRRKVAGLIHRPAHFAYGSNSEPRPNKEG